VEGVEHPSAWAVGVQWHPEDSDGTGVDLHALFTALIEASETRDTSLLTARHHA